LKRYETHVVAQIRQREPRCHGYAEVDGQHGLCFLVVVGGERDGRGETCCVTGSFDCSTHWMGVFPGDPLFVSEFTHGDLAPLRQPVIDRHHQCWWIHKEFTDDQVRVVDWRPGVAPEQ